MSKILEIAEINGSPFVFCTPHEKDFIGAKSITIFGDSDKTVRLTKFCLERTKQCFSNKPVAPWFRVDEEVDGRFLQVGNGVDFDF